MVDVIARCVIIISRNIFYVVHVVIYVQEIIHEATKEEMNFRYHGFE